MQLALRWLIIVIGLSLLVACGGAPPAAAPRATVLPAAVLPAGEPSAGQAFTNITVSDLKQKLDQGQQFILLDVRTPEEYTGDGHVAGSRLLPLQELASRAGELPKDQPIVCICRSGNRSQTACDQLHQLGFTDLMNVEGGMRAWAQAGFPIERP